MRILTASRILAMVAAVFGMMSLVLPWMEQQRIVDKADGSGATHSSFTVVGYRLATRSPLDGAHLAHPWFQWWLLLATVAVLAVTFVTSFTPGWRWTLITLATAAVALVSSWPPISGMRVFVTGGSTESTAVQSAMGCDMWRLAMLLVIVATGVGGYFTKSADA